MSGLDDAVDKAKDFINDNKEKVGDALKSEQAESVSDKVLDGVEGFANKVTGGKFEQQIGDARDNVDKSIGNE